jgi:hypothetical protein
MNWKQTVLLLNILAMSSTVEYVVYETEPDTPIDTAVVPEPSTLSLAVILLMGIAIRQRRRV